MEIETKPLLEIEYLCLNPAVIFNRIVQRAEKVVLASGTLEPSDEFKLLPNYETISWRFHCGHVVAKENFKAIAVSEGFDFRFENRNQPQTIKNAMIFI